MNLPEIKTVPQLPRQKSDEELAVERDKQVLDLARICWLRGIEVKTGLEFRPDYILEITEEKRGELERKKQQALERFKDSA